MIKPTIGRVVWYYALGKTQLGADTQPHAALVAFVTNDSLVNLGWMDALGNHQSAVGVRLVQREDLSGIQGDEAFCTWMPYQVEAAKKDQAANLALPKGEKEPSGTGAVGQQADGMRGGTLSPPKTVPDAVQVVTETKPPAKNPEPGDSFAASTTAAIPQPQSFPTGFPKGGSHGQK